MKSRRAPGGSIPIDLYSRVHDHLKKRGLRSREKGTVYEEALEYYLASPAARVAELEARVRRLESESMLRKAQAATKQPA
jgi:hypothetical protein